MTRRPTDARATRTSNQNTARGGKTAADGAGSQRAPRAPSDHVALGAAGEQRAAAHLRARGYRIVATNVRAGGVELDLVVRRGRLLAFVEVKTRRGTGLGPPELAVDARKQARLVRGAGAWLDAHPLPARMRVRFDVVACQVSDHGGPDERWAIRHLADAFISGD